MYSANIHFLLDNLFYHFTGLKIYNLTFFYI